VGKIDLGPSPIQLMATPDGKHVCVARRGTEAAPNDTVSVIDTASGAVAKTLTTGLGAHGVSVSADGALGFVTNIANNSVSIIDVPPQEMVATVPVGRWPERHRLWITELTAVRKGAPESSSATDLQGAGHPTQPIISCEWMKALAIHVIRRGAPPLSAQDPLQEKKPCELF